MGGRLQNLYFDWVYTPVYDATVGQLAPYQRLQERSVDRLTFKPGDAVLCIGVGTGNEITRLMGREGAVGLRMAATDLARPALKKTYKKTRGTVGVAVMDAHCLAFADGVFDAVLCLHTMDFLEAPDVATEELFRVLKPGGSFVVSYPTGKGGPGLLQAVAGSVSRKARHGRVFSALSEMLASLGSGLAYAPLFLAKKPRERFYSHSRIHSLLGSMRVASYDVDEDLAYQDLIVWGKR